MNLRILVAASALLAGGAVAPLAAQPPVTLQEVVVTATRSPHALADVPVETVVIGREEIERSTAQNLPQLLRTLPGTSATNLDDTLASDNLRLSVRGLQLNEGYGLILVDGRRVHGGFGAHGDYGISLNQIPLSMIERIEIVRGASSALYGSDAMAGVINIITRPVPEAASGSVGVRYGTYDVLPRAGFTLNDRTRHQGFAHASVGAPVGARSGFFLQFARQFDQGSDQSPQDTVRDTLLGKWHTELSPRWSVTLDGALAYSRRETAAASGTTERYDRKYDDYRAGASLGYRSDAHAWSLSGHRFHQDFTHGFPGFQFGHRFGEVVIDQAETIFTRFGRRHWVTVGAEAQRQKLDYVFHNFRGGELETLVPVRESIETYSLFLQDEIWLQNDRLILVPGVRYEEHARFGDEVNPKLSASLRTGAATTWRASVGRAFKSPTIRQLYYEGPFRHGNYFIESNPGLRPETAVSTNASVEQVWLGGRLWWSFGLFHTALRDKVVQVDTGRSIDDIPVQSYENVQRARIQGAELAFRAVGPRGFAVRGSAAWTDSEIRDTGLDIPYVPTYTATLIPGYVSASGLTGAEALVTAVGRQFRNVANTQTVCAHRVVDLRLWRSLGEKTTASLDLGNIFASHMGDEDFAFRQGRRIALALNSRF